MYETPAGLSELHELVTGGVRPQLGLQRGQPCWRRIDLLGELTADAGDVGPMVSVVYPAAKGVELRLVGSAVRSTEGQDLVSTQEPDLRGVNGAWRSSSGGGD